MKKTIPIFFSILLNISFVFGQLTYSNVELFNEGSYFLNRNDYKEALYFFKQLADKYQKNAHYNFLAGECYLNMENQEHQAIPYFQKAITKTVAKKDYRKKQFEETNAPHHAYFYLGNAYRSAGKLDEALNAYQVFIDSPYYLYNYNERIVDNEILACERAKRIKENPINIEQVKLDTLINTKENESNPVISENGKTLVFIRSLKFYDAIFYTVKNEQGNWEKPVNITEQIQSDGDIKPTSVNYNGTKLLLIKSTKNTSDIYSSQLINGQWSKAVKFDNRINSSSYEISACYGADTNELFWVSNRIGGNGGFDIFRSTYDLKKKKWLSPKQIDELNTEFDEHAVCFNRNCNTLYFSSQGHNNMGGYDIFFSKKNNNTWEKPVNIGFPINSTRNDLFFQPIKNCTEGIMSKPGNITDNESDLYFLRILGR